MVKKFGDGESIIQEHAAEAMSPEKGAGDYRERLFCQTVLPRGGLSGAFYRGLATIRQVVEGWKR